MCLNLLEVFGFIQIDVAVYCRIIKEVHETSYEPSVVECFEVLGGSGKKRVVSNLNVVDRFIIRLLTQKLKRYIEPQFQRNSFAYQEGKELWKLLWLPAFWLLLFMSSRISCCS